MYGRHQRATIEHHQHNSVLAASLALVQSSTRTWLMVSSNFWHCQNFIAGYLWCAWLWQHILDSVSQYDIGHHFRADRSHRVVVMTVIFCLGCSSLHVARLSLIQLWFSWLFACTDWARWWKISSTPTFMSFHNESLLCVSLQKWWKILISTHHISGLRSPPFQDRWVWTSGHN